MKRKGKLTKSATVFSNDPEKPKMIISLGGKVKQYISVMPNNRIHLLGFEGDKIKKEVTITSFEEQPLEITDVTSTVNDKIKCKLNTIKKGKEYILEVKNRSTKAGTFNGRIIIKTSSKKKPHIVLNVSANLRRKVTIRPTAFFFGTINTTKENFDSKMLEKRAVLRDVQGDGFTIKKIKPSSKWIKAEIEVKKEKKRYAIHLILDRDKLPKGKFEEKIKIYTSYKGKPLVVDVRGEVI